MRRLFGCWRKRVSVATSARSVFTVPGSCVIDVPIAVVNSSHGPRDPKMMREEILTDEYLCGTVRYEVYGPFLRVGHSHYLRCRRNVFCNVCGLSLFGGDWQGWPEVSIRFGDL